MGTNIEVPKDYIEAIKDYQKEHEDYLIVIRGILKSTGEKIYWMGNSHYCSDPKYAKTYSTYAGAKGCLTKGTWAHVIKNEVNNVEIKEMKIRYEVQ